MVTPLTRFKASLTFLSGVFLIDSMERPSATMKLDFNVLIKAVAVSFLATVFTTTSANNLLSSSNSIVTETGSFATLNAAFAYSLKPT